jgi:hypothetical protein
MTKTILILLVGGAAALASLVLGNGLSSTTATRPATLAWEQPPILAPRPGDQIIILKSVNNRPRGLIAWEQPPILAPRPGDQIIILKSREPVGNDRVVHRRVRDDFVNVGVFVGINRPHFRLGRNRLRINCRGERNHFSRYRQNRHDEPGDHEEQHVNGECNRNPWNG